jgi:hypothetical protein
MAELRVCATNEHAGKADVRAHVPIPELWSGEHTLWHICPKPVIDRTVASNKDGDLPID